MACTCVLEMKVRAQVLELEVCTVEPSDEDEGETLTLAGEDLTLAGEDLTIGD